MVQKISRINHNAFNSGKFVKSYYEDTDGILDIEKIFSENGTESNYFISGPPAMIKAFKQTLIGKGDLTLQLLTNDWK